MSESGKTTYIQSGIGLPNLLTVVFVVMKLTGYIDWPWIWVLSPTWISFLLGIALFLFFLLLSILIVLFKKD